jgi:hypothetical protein
MNAHASFSATVLASIIVIAIVVVLCFAAYTTTW